MNLWSQWWEASAWPPAFGPGLFAWLFILVTDGSRALYLPLQAKEKLFLDAQCICDIFSATKPSSAGASNLGWYFGDQEGNYPLG